MKVNPNATYKDFKKYGFTEHHKGYLYFNRMLSKEYEISFSLSVRVRDMKLERVDILDENFCQPYDYQFYLEQNKNNKFALGIKKKVDDRLLDMQEKGLIEGFTVGDYV